MITDEMDAFGMPDLGACCACDKAGPSVRNIMMLDKRAPVAGTGWGCVQCGQPQDGTIAVLCDDCIRTKAPILDVCYGVPGEGRRMSIHALLEPFSHDMSQHPEIGAMYPYDEDAT